MRAALFPGQGVRTSEVVAALEASPDHVEHASEVLGYDVLKKARTAARGKSKVLPTAVAQPAIFVAEVAAIEEADDPFDIVAGHSLGEYAALVAAGSLTFIDGLQLVSARGEAMGRVSRNTSGGMAALIGLGIDDVGDLCKQAGVVVANDNAPDQVVVSGSDDGLARIAQLAHEAGARAVLLGVEGPFHTDAVAGASLKLAAALRDVDIKPPGMPVMSNVTARPYEDPAEIRDLLIAQVHSPVRWRESIEWMWGAGVRDFVDLGPGRILASLVQRTTRQLAELSGARA